jgi:hypothetical protein
MRGFLIATTIRTLYRNIAIYFAKRRALREYRRELEHRRKMELAQKTIELIAAFASGAVAMMQKKAEIDAEKHKSPSGGIVHEPGPNVDDREWMPGGRLVFVKPPKRGAN